MERVQGRPLQLPIEKGTVRVLYPCGIPFFPGRELRKGRVFLPLVPTPYLFIPYPKISFPKARTG